MNLRIRLSLNELETRETPSGIDPMDPGGTTSAPPPAPPAQTAPTPPGTVIPPVDPYAP